MTPTESDLREALQLLEAHAPALPPIDDRPHARRYLVAAAATIVVAIAATASLVGHNRSDHSAGVPSPQPATSSPAPVPVPVPVPVTIPTTCPSDPQLQLHIEPLPAGQKPVHTASDARAAVEREKQYGPEHITTVAVASVTDPVADKIDLPGGARAMWIVYGYSASGGTPPTAGVPAHGPAYTRYAVLALVDDATLQLGGSFTC